MPIPRAVLAKASRRGGDLPAGKPSATQLDLLPSPVVDEPVEAPVEPAKRYARPVPGKAATQAPQVSGDGLTITIKSASIKENKNGVYRSITAADNAGNLYWFSLPIDQPAPDKGLAMVIFGETGTPFGKPEKPIIPFKKVHRLDKAPSHSPVNTAKVSNETSDKVVEEMRKMVNTYGFSTILKALAALTN